MNSRTRGDKSRAGLLGSDFRLPGSGCCGTEKADTGAVAMVGVAEEFAAGREASKFAADIGDGAEGPESRGSSTAGV